MITFKVQRPGMQKQSLMFHGVFPQSMGVYLKQSSLAMQRILPIRTMHILQKRIHGKIKLFLDSHSIVN